MSHNRPTVAYFVTPHGYGHAARASAVMAALRDPAGPLHFEIFTRVPEWFFTASVGGDAFTYHTLASDIGLVQTSAMQEDLPATIRLLEDFLPFSPALVDELAEQIRALGCTLVLCDIAPLGIAVAHAAGLPAVLVENFTWDWIYAGYLDEEPRFAPYIAVLQAAFAAADVHIRTAPACTQDPPADVLTEAVSRKPRIPAAQTRQQLGVPGDVPLVLLTMGGILTAYPFIDQLVNAEGVRFLVPGGAERFEQRGSLIALPAHSAFYHPDLVAAANAVVGKLGYSTLAETYAAGLPFAFVPRARFRESPPMAAYARHRMNALEISEAAFFSGDWLFQLPALLEQGRRPLPAENGADQIARFLAGQRLLTV